MDCGLSSFLRTIMRKSRALLPLSRTHAVCIADKRTSVYFVSNEEDETQNENKMEAVTMAAERNRENKNRE